MRSFSAAGTRRRLLRIGAALLPVGGFAALFSEEFSEEAEAGRRRRRSLRNRRQLGNNKNKNKRKGKRKGKGKAKPRPNACLPPGTDLQAAINAANPGDLLLLCEGLFAVNKLLIPKTLSIGGAGVGKTILDGQSLEWVVIVETPAGWPNDQLMSVALSSMTVTRSGGDRPAIVNSYTLGTNPAVLELAFMEVTRNNGSGILNQGILNMGGGVSVTFNTTTGNGGSSSPAAASARQAVKPRRT